LTTTRTANGATIRYTVLAKNIPTYRNLQLVDRLSELGYVGIDDVRAPVRMYPATTLAASVVGFMGYDDQLNQAGRYPYSGSAGVEAMLNAQLTGTDGTETYLITPNGRIPNGTTQLVEPVDGVDYDLTIDLDLQHMSDLRLAEAVKQYGARSGMAITMNVKTGEILAMSNYPTFDPNSIADPTSDGVKNLAIMDTYEPGSVEKVLTMAALVDQGLVTPQTQLVVPASIMSAGAPIKDAFQHGQIQLTAAGVIAKSSNIGMVLLARQMSKASFASYLVKYGLGTRTGIGLPEEQTGTIPGADMSDQTRDQIAFGQGLSVTAIQEAAAIAAVVNNGLYVQPTILKSATDGAGAPVALPVQETHRVISPAASLMVRQMMESMVTTTSGNPYSIDGYRTGTKSGTAQAIDPKCGCYNGLVVSFVGVAPIEDPTLLTYVVIDHPQGDVFGSVVAAPVYKDIMSVALPRYGVPTSTTTPPEYEVTW